MESLENKDTKTLIFTPISNAVFETIGQRITFDVSLSRNYQKIGDFELNPKMCGPVGAIFSNIQVAVFVAIGPAPYRDAIFLRYDYKYKHPDGGSNGYTLTQELPVAA
jgi:hypothetical protein